MRHAKLVSTLLLFAVVDLILFAATMAVPASAADLTVGAQGQFKSIQQAVDAAKPGDTVLIAPGTYTENVVVNKPLMISAAGSRPTVRSADASKDVFQLTSSGVRIDGLMITGGASGVNIQNTSKCVVTNIVARDNVRAVYLSQSKENEISNSNLAGNGYGVYSDYSSNNTISSNVATFEKGAVNALGDGIYLTHSSSNKITNNNLSANHDFGLSLYVSRWNIISNNTINDNEQVGIRIGPDADNNTFTYNMFARNGFTRLVMKVSLPQPSGKDFPPSGILIVGAKGNRIYLNDFISQRSAIIDTSAAAILSSKEKVVYTYKGVEQTGYMSNYYSDYKGTDTNGNGIGSTPSVYGDKYPLIQSVASYGLTPVGAVTPTPSPTLTLTSTATSGDQSAGGITLPGLQVMFALGGFAIAGLVMFGWKVSSKIF